MISAAKVMFLKENKYDNTMYNKKYVCVFR